MRKSRNATCTKGAFSRALAGALVGMCSVGFAAETSTTQVVSEVGLQLSYQFHTHDNGLIRDSSAQNSDNALSIRVKPSPQVRLGTDGLEIHAATIVGPKKSPKVLVQKIKQGAALSVAAWIRPANTEQTGPARILTLSRNSNERNFTLGQNGERIEARLRTTKTSTNGIPSLASRQKQLQPQVWTHIAFTFSVEGQAKLFLNGQIDAQQDLGGNLSNWDESHTLAIGNEISGDRPWLGDIMSLVIFDRDLSDAEVRQRYEAGVKSVAPSPEQLLANQLAENSRLFETKIAPIISAHCLECHDPVTKQGGLDLSRKLHALSGGDSGPVLAGGKSAESLLWMRVATNEMPENRDPLTADEKDLLKQWIDKGGQWSLEFVDPAIYARSDVVEKVYVQRLTVPEYIETVRSTLNVDVTKEATELLPRDVRADGFSNTAYNLTVDLAHIEAYAQLAELVLSRVDVAKLVLRFTKSRELTDENVRLIVEPMGRKLLRGPVTKEEVAYFCGVSTSVAAAGGDIDEAILYVLEAMLQSPRFIYRIENHSGDGQARPVSPYELVSRLSYIIWGGPPDEELLVAADKNQLTQAEIERQVQRMLNDPRAIVRSQQFIKEWLNLGGLMNLRPNAEKFPNWNAQLSEDMRAETLAYYKDVVWQENRPLSDLLNSQWTYLTPRLAQHYGLRITDELQAAGPDELVRYDLTNIKSRGGLLTHGSVLTKGGDEASMVSRGLFVMNELLRGVVRDPPPCVDTNPQPSRPGLSQRMVSEQRLASESCVGCHIKFEPLAFGLERFDGLGSYHEQDEFQNPLREDGEILFPGEEQPIEFESSAQLMQVLASSERVRESFTWKVTQFAIARPLDAADARAISKIHRISQDNGGTYRALIAAIASSDIVRFTRTESP